MSFTTALTRKKVRIRRASRTGSAWQRGVCMPQVSKTFWRGTRPQRKKSHISYNRHESETSPVVCGRTHLGQHGSEHSYDVHAGERTGTGRRAHHRLSGETAQKGAGTNGPNPFALSGERELRSRASHTFRIGKERLPLQGGRVDGRMYSRYRLRSSKPGPPCINQDTQSCPLIRN